MRGLSAWLGGLLVLGLFVGCSDSGSGTSPMAHGGSSGSSGSGPVKVCDYGCTCDNGLQGTWDCDLDACSCAACPAFAPPEPEPFEACGGDPTGLWRPAAGKNDRRGFDLSLTSPAGNVIQCRGQLSDQMPPRQYLLELKGSGQAALLADIPAQKFQIAESCLAGASASCGSLQGFGCERTTCGLCECTNPAAAAALEDLTWSVAEDELVLTGEDFAEQIPFCVKDDTLTYLADGASDPLTFERIYRTGEPQLCAERRPADCTKGDRQTCQLGQCVGTGSCSEAGAGAAACAKFQNCAWEPDSCYGNVYVYCSLSDLVDGAPGCALAETPPRCVGRPWACEDQPGCAAKGCLIGPACIGGQHKCEYDDEGVEGCVCDLTCTGTLNCATIKDAATCKDSGQDQGLIEACRWSTTACVATATPCEDLSINECDTTIGCHLEAQ
jgi:hypothetical protein